MVEHPFVYEINTWAWLDELARALGRPVGLGNVPAGEWDAENVGIAPDVEVELDPELVRKGNDPQLERAIKIVMTELEANPVPKPKRPAYPNYHKKKITTTGSR